MPRTHIRLLTLVATLLLALSGCKAGVELAIHDEDSATMSYEIQVAHSDYAKWIKLAKGMAKGAGDLDASALQEPRNCADLLNANSTMQDWERYLDVQDNSTNDEIRCIINQDYNIYSYGFELDHDGSVWTLSADGGGAGSGVSIGDIYSAIFGAIGLDGADELLEQTLLTTITMPAPVTSVSWKDAKINGNSVTFDAMHQKISDLVITAEDGAQPIGRAEGIVSPAEPEGKALSGGAIAGIAAAGVALAAVAALVIALLVRRARMKRLHTMAQPSGQFATAGQFGTQVPEAAVHGNVAPQPVVTPSAAGNASSFEAAPMQRPMGDLTPEQERAWQEYYAKYAQYRRELEQYQARHTE